MSPSFPSSLSTRCSRRRSPSVTEEGFGFDPQRGELWFAGEAAEAVLLELESRRRELEREVAELQAQARAAEREVAETATSAEEAEAAYAEVAHLRAARAADPGCCGDSSPAPTGSTKL